MKLKFKNIILFILLFVIICVGIFAIMFLRSEKNSNEMVKTESESYYFENLLYKYEDFVVGNLNNILDYRGSATKIIKDNDAIKLIDISKNKVLNEFSITNEDEFFSKDAYCVDVDLNFYTISYNQELKQAIIESFDAKGNKKDNAVSLRDFKGLIVYDGSMDILKIKVDNNYIYILSFTNNGEALQIFKLNGDLYETYENVKWFDIDKSGKLYITRDASVSGTATFEKVNLDTKEVEFKKSTIVKWGLYISYSESENMLYIAGLDKMCKYNADDGQFVKDVIVFGEDTSYFPHTSYYMPEHLIKSFFIDKQSNIFLTLETYEAGNVIHKCYKYNTVKGKKPEIATTLTITSPYRQDFLSDAIVRYEAKYPNQKIKYDYEYTTREEFYKNESSYGKRLTTKILANDVGDIVMTGGSTLVFRDVFKTDAFMNLSELIKNDKNYSSLNKSAIEGITIDGAIRGLPVSLACNYFELNTALLENIGVEFDYENLRWSDVFDLLKIIEQKSPESYLFVTYYNNFNSSMEEILEPMLIANMPDLIDIKNKKVDLSQKWFIDLIEQLKNSVSSENFMQKNVKFDVIDQLKNSLFNFKANSLDTRKDSIGRYYNYCKDDRKSVYIPLLKGEKSNNRVAKTINMYSINNRTDNKENAWQFLSFLLEEEMQTIGAIPGAGLNLNAERKVSGDIEKINYGMNDEVWWKMMEPIYTDIDYMYDLDYFKDDIKAPILEYLTDKLTLEEAIKKAEDNVWIRLNE